MNIRRLGFSALFCAFAVLSSSTFAATAAETPDILYRGNGAEPKDLDPHTSTGVGEFQIIQALFEGLTNKHPKTLEIIPGVAERWESSKDGKKWTFHLRKNAKWSNGDPVTAQDFVYSWFRLIDPKTASEYAYQGHYFKNAKSFAEGKIKEPKQVGFRAKDAYTLEVELENPTPYFLSLLFHHSLYPAHKATVEKYGMRWTRPENMVSNGPFKLTTWETNKIIKVAKSPNYWDAAVVKLNEIHYFPTENIDTEEKMFRSGQLDVTYEIPQEKIDFWKRDKSGVLYTYAYLGNYHYLINTTKAPMNDKRVRKALALSLDRERLVKYVTRGGQAPAQALTPPGTGGFNVVGHLPKDASRVGEAKKLLAEAGYPDGKNFPAIEILYNTSASHKKIAEALQTMWKENLGIQVKLLNQEWKVYLDTMRTKNYFLARQGWIGDYNDPNTFLDMYMTDNGNNRTGFANKEYDGLLEAAARETDHNKRLALFQKAEDILAEELPVIPIYIYTRNYLINTRVQGWEKNIEDVHPLKFVSKPGSALAKKP